MNLFLELLHSVIRPKSYEIFLQDRKWKSFLFGFVLVFFYFFITIVIPVGRFQASTGGIVNMIDEYVPDFTIENRSVHVSRQVEYSDSGTYVFVNTDETFIGRADSDMKSLVNAYDRILVMDAQQAVIKNNGQIQYINYEDLDEDLFMTKETLFESLGSAANIIFAVGIVVIFVGMELLFFFGVLFVALFGMIVASCMHYNLTFGQLYKLGIYTRTTPLLIKAVLSFMPFGIPAYFVISVGISLCYLAAAIRHMKTPVLTNGPLSFSSTQSGPVTEDSDPWNFGNDN